MRVKERERKKVRQMEIGSGESEKIIGLKKMRRKEVNRSEGKMERWIVKIGYMR